MWGNFYKCKTRNNISNKIFYSKFMIFQNLMLIYLIFIVCDRVDFIYMYVLINICCKYA